jgi:hypothetical protein
VLTIVEIVASPSLPGEEQRAFESLGPKKSKTKTAPKQNNRLRRIDRVIERNEKRLL